MTTRKPPAAAWKPGQSGNPKGRPLGSGEVSKLRAAIADRVPELLAAMMTRALDGDVGAARLLLERAIAPLKSIEPGVTLQLPDGGLTDKGRAVLNAVADGELSPSQGAALVSAIGTLARITEIDELSARIAALEAQTHVKP